MTTAAIWSRVSSDEQEVSNQLEVLQEWAQRRGLEVVREYTLEGESAFNGKHKAHLTKMLDDARQGRFEIVLCWALDRLSREGPLDTLQLVDRLAKAGVAVASYQEPWVEVSGDMRDLLLSITAWVARMESKRKSERVKAALARRKREGLPIGRQPGAKDSKPRKRSGYVARWERQRQAR